jgi:hypothetical protein
MLRVPLGSARGPFCAIRGHRTVCILETLRAHHVFGSLNTMVAIQGLEPIAVHDCRGRRSAERCGPDTDVCASTSGS